MKLQRPARAGSTKRRRSAALKGDEAAAGSGGDLEEIAARAARLGITSERVLEEYAHIAFADLRHIVEWGPDGLKMKASVGLSEADAAPISEIVAGAGAGSYRVKLYDKKAALDAIARYLGMFPPVSRRRDDEVPTDPAEDAREVLARSLARLAAGSAEGASAGEADTAPGGGADP